MTKGANDRDPLYSGPPFDSHSLRLDSLQYLLLEKWIVDHIVEVPSARLPLKTAYLFYMHYCDSQGIPGVSIQAFNRALADVLPSQWPTARRRRTARGTLYDNLTLRGWVSDPSELPSSGGESSNCLELCEV